MLPSLIELSSDVPVVFVRSLSFVLRGLLVPAGDVCLSSCQPPNGRSAGVGQQPSVAYRSASDVENAAATDAAILFAPLTMAAP